MQSSSEGIRIIGPSELKDDVMKQGNNQAWSKPTSSHVRKYRADERAMTGDIPSYVSLRIIIILSFLIATATVGVLSWFLTYQSSEKSISTISRDLQAGIQLRLSKSFEDSLIHAEDVVQTNKKIIQSGLVNPLYHHDMYSLMKIFWSEVRTFRSSSTATITTTKGELWGHFIYPGSMKYGIWETVNGTTTEYSTNDAADIRNSTWTNTNPNNLSGAWYTVIDAADMSQSTWTDMYIWESRFWITRSSGAYLPNGTFVGVLCSDIELGFVDTIISDVKSHEQKDVDIFVIDKHDQLIGSSLHLDVIGCDDAASKCAGNAYAHKIGDFDNKMTRAISEYLKHNKQGFSGVKTTTIDIGGSEYMVSVSTLQREGLEWRICSVIPQSVYMSGIQRNRWTTMAYVFGLIGGLEIALLFFSIYITRPLSDIALAMMQISQLNFEHTNKNDTKNHPIKEVALIQTSFRKMNVALQTFGKFVPLSVVKRIMKNTTIANDLYVERKTLTIMFSDLKGFTSLAESLPIDVLLKLLSEYLEMMSTFVSDSDGVICDFIGDGIMSFWNSPVAVAHHEALAIKTALLQTEALQSLNSSWISQGYIREGLEMRIGIHTGEVLVGNIGSKSRMKYGAVGDAVNLASRLEGLNKRYGTKIIISDATYERVKDGFSCRPLEMVVVKGRSEPIRVYEVIGIANKPGNESERASVEPRRRVLEDVQDLHLKSAEDKLVAIDRLQEYVCHHNDIAASRILEIISDAMYSGVSVLDEK